MTALAGPDVRDAAAAARHFEAAARLHESGNLEAAVSQYRRGVARAPDFAPGHMVLGLALAALGLGEDAERSLRRAIELQPALADAHLAIGKLHFERGARESAADSFREALRHQPESIPALCELWRVLDELVAIDERADVAARYVALRPDHVEAQWDAALHLLNAGRMTEGWARYHYRWRRPGFERWHYDLPYPEWNGEPLAGKHILLWREQGVGDEIMFASCLPDAISAAGHVTYACTKRLLPLFARSFPGATIIDSDRIEPPAPEPFDVDYHGAIGSLPRWFRPALDRFPVHRGYLAPDPAAVAAWRERLAALGPGLRIGISWRSQFMTADRAKSYTTLDQWEPILRVPGVTYVNLQYDDCALALATAHDMFGVAIHHFPDLDLKNDFDGTAALMANLDLIVSIPNSVGELAGALGRPVWRLIPGPPGDWTMLGLRDRRPWYPTMEVIGGAKVGHWDDVIRTTAAKLARFTTAARA
jgi:tetratricopeptide (TPR) repeat protein